LVFLARARPGKNHRTGFGGAAAWASSGAGVGADQQPLQGQAPNTTPLSRRGGAIGQKPDPSFIDIIGLRFLVISGADAPVKDVKAPGAETALAASNVAGLQS
jgi:hypothetical protein